MKHRQMHRQIIFQNLPYPTFHIHISRYPGFETKNPGQIPFFICGMKGNAQNGKNIILKPSRHSFDLTARTPKAYAVWGIKS